MYATFPSFKLPRRPLAPARTNCNSGRPTLLSTHASHTADSAVRSYLSHGVKKT